MSQHVHSYDAIHSPEMKALLKRFSIELPPRVKTLTIKVGFEDSVTVVIEQYCEDAEGRK